MDQNKYRAKNAIFGWIIGDALGATLEFYPGEVARRKIIYNYANFDKGLVGGGPFQIEPGQFTDDTEMGLANMSSVIQLGFYDRETVANAYHSWFLSNPVDIGKATKAAVSQKSAKEMAIIGKTTNVTSLSNGFLMRLPGLIALYHTKFTDDLINAIYEDVRLTHGHDEVPSIAVIYGLMLRKAIQGESAMEIYQWGKNHCETSELFSNIYKSIDNDLNAFYYNDRLYTLKEIDSNICGFVGFAIFLLLTCLKKHHSYKTAILDVVGYGGDTDTNACIVGSVMGAIYPETIPKIWIESVLSCDNQNRFNDYPIANPAIWTKWLP